MSSSSGSERKQTSSSELDEQDIAELAEFFDLLARFDYEDTQKERPHGD